MRTYEFDAMAIKLAVDEPLTDEEVDQVKARLRAHLHTFAMGLRPLGRGKGYGVYVTALAFEGADITEVHRTATGKALRDPDFERLADEAEAER